MNLIYFVVLFFYLNTIDGLPQVRVRPSTAVILSSSETRLRCESNDTPFLSVAYWTHTGQRIELNPSIIEMHDNELHIFQFGDTAYTQPGAYACVVSTRYGLLESEPAMLSLPTLDPFKISINETNLLNLPEGNTAVIPCELPNGNPRPIPIFTFNDKRLDVELRSNRYKILPSGNLHIIDIKQSDRGTYQCSARNPLTEQTVRNSQTTILEISSKPSNSKDRLPLTTVYRPPVASKVLVGSNFSIECVIAGWPNPIVEWEKYGDILPEKRTEVLHGTLYLTDIRMDDRGTYICRASSSNGQSDIAYTALLEVLEPPKILQRPDSVIQINRGESLSIKCGFRGRPEPIISWLYNGEEIIINGSPVTGGVLSLNQPKEGIYQCIGRNSYGISHASTVVILPNNTKTQQDKIDENNSPKESLIIIGPSNVTVYEGETIQLHCLTQSGSTIQWLHNNEMINLNIMRRFEMLASGGLRIVSAQKSDSGIYECLASKNGFGTSTSKCFVHIQEKSNIPPATVSHGAPKVELTDISQIDSTTVELTWNYNEKYDRNFQIQYRLIHNKSSWITDNQLYTHPTTQAIISNLDSNQNYKFRLINYDRLGRMTILTPARRVTLKQTDQLNLAIPQITDAWITNEGHINLKWKMNDTFIDHIDEFLIYYRLVNSNENFTKIIVPNIRFPMIDSYTIKTIKPNEKYELRMATYSSRGLSQMSNSMEISIPFTLNSRHLNFNQKNLDEILENLTKSKTANPTQIMHDLASPNAATSANKNSDLLYLTIGIISGILLILIIILIVMCVLRILQRKKFIAHVKSANGSEYYCDGLHKPLNPDYATTPCLQHGVVAVDGKLIPFAYPTHNGKQAILWNNGQVTDNGTMRLNTNPMNRMDNENRNDQQENFYHTLTPFNNQCDEQSCAPTVFGYSTDHSTMSTCPIHHRVVNYPSDTFPFKLCLNNKDNPSNKKLSGNSFNHHQHHYHHHGTCQRLPKTQRITTPIVSEHLRGGDDQQQQDLCDRSFSSSSAGGGGHYCTHSSNDSTRPLISQSIDTNENFKQLAPPSTGSSSHSSSGIGSSVESPYNHWKYLTPLSVTTTNDRKIFSSDNENLQSTSKEQELIPTEMLSSN